MDKCQRCGVEVATGVAHVCTYHAAMLPVVIFAKVHGASRDALGGRHQLIGGWDEHQRPGQYAFVRKDIHDALHAACTIVSAMLQAACGDNLTFTIEGRSYSVGDALDAADAALALLARPGSAEPEDDSNLIIIEDGKDD